MERKMQDLRSARTKAQDSFVETFSGGWPWVRKRKAVRSCIEVLERFVTDQATEEEEPVSKYKYKVTLGFEKFPTYWNIRQEGDWFLFYSSDDVLVTFRHKDEESDHTLYYQTEIVKEQDERTAIETAERHCLYHVVCGDAERIKEE